MSPKPHVEIAAIIPDDQGRIVIGKRKGKDGSEGMANEQQALHTVNVFGPFMLISSLV